jgi:hypothetical protein
MSIKKLSWLLITGVIAAVLLYASFLIYISWPLGSLDVSKSGVFGDSFGILSSLFSGLAFAGLIITVLMQREELALQRQELELTRDEIHGQREELKIQNETLRLQKFENTFFQMLSLHNEILKDISVNNKKGRDAFQELRTLLRAQEKNHGIQGDREPIRATYSKFDSLYGHEIGHYFRNLYNVIKFVDNSNIAEKKFYTNLVRAQLSNFELSLLFYNCLSDKGSEKFKPLVEKYSILKNLPDELIFNPALQKPLYDSKAFGVG